jgi:hypothetical protein
MSTSANIYQVVMISFSELLLIPENVKMVVDS